MARQTTPHFQERAASQTLGLHRCSVGDEALLSVRVLNLEQPDRLVFLRINNPAILRDGDRVLTQRRVPGVEQPNRLGRPQRFGGAEDRLKPVKHTCSLSVRSERKSRFSSLPNATYQPRRALRAVGCMRLFGARW